MPRPVAVLFDSGGVLMRPKGGRWNPRADFEDILREHFPTLTDADLAGAVEAGDAYFAGALSTPDYDDYHRVMLARLGLTATPELLADLRRPVDPKVILETFPDVLPTLRALRGRGVRMAVVSDAWAELPQLHDALGLGGFFEAYAISQLLGCHKPDPRMYRYASDALGLQPAQCLFVDDAPDLVEAAIALGYQGRAVLREPPAQPCTVDWITGIDQVLSLV
ncbi:HAD family hydrolase [Hamadaea tsunoensis]|uniref:HAD family hydrolase n=1 Tax=Hamadaea tsunoensis TaxID=53368 RepID=UPI0004161F7D|nr:HAD-IA family hydrolase [Hamadaea tsunoensis]